MVNILVVDDKRENRYLLETLLKSKGYEVHSAENGHDALKLLVADDFQLIISDILMPEMDGYQLCRECKKDKRFSSIPFVFYTATYTEERDENFALGLGADRFLRKPMDPGKMLEEVDLVLENSTKKKRRKKPSLKHEAEIYKIYSQRLVKKLEKKMLDLEISEKLYRTIFDNALDAIYLNYLDDRDVPGKFLQVNQIACDLLGYSKEEFSDLTPADLDTHKYRDQNIMVVMELVKERSVTFRTDHKAKNGDIIPVEISSHLFLLEGKRAVLSVARDIRKRLEKDKELAFAERNWFMTVNSMDEVIMVVDNNRIIQMINNSGAMLLQKRKDEIVGNPCFEVFHDIADPNTSCPFTESIEKGLSKSKEYYYRSKDKYFSCKSTPVYQPGEKNLRYIIVMADITDKKRKEIEINNYREELERLVAERTDNLENKNEELKNYIKIFEHREFRIKELRDEVKILKAELEKQ